MQSSPGASGGPNAPHLRREDHSPAATAPRNALAYRHSPWATPALGATMSRKVVSNADVARPLREMALFLELDDVPFKPQAYEKAAYAVTALDHPLAKIVAEGGVKALDDVPGIGAGIAVR